jgi:hypothetical protein
MVWSTLHDPALLEWRVRRLVGGALTNAGPRRSRVLVAITFAAIALAASPALSGPVHRLTETLVSLLP